MPVCHYWISVRWMMKLGLSSRKIGGKKSYTYAKNAKTRRIGVENHSPRIKIANSHSIR